MVRKLVLSLALLLFSQWASAYSYTVEITQAELQSRVSAMMPLEKQLFMMTLVLSQPVIDLGLGNNEIGIASRVDVLAPGGVKGAGYASITGSLEYVPESGEFYFKNPKVVKLDIENMPPVFLPDIKHLAQLAAAEYLSARPVYKLDTADLRQKMAKAMLKSIRVENNVLMVELEAF